MLSVDLFAEDQAHELFAASLLRRILGGVGLPYRLGVRSAVGGHGRALTELQTYQRAVLKQAAGLVRPDLLVVMIDANCKGMVKARNDIRQETRGDCAGDTLIACPDPHIERWLFADPECFAPQVSALTSNPASRSASETATRRCCGTQWPVGATFRRWAASSSRRTSFSRMDLHRAGRNEPSLGALIDDLQAFAIRAAH